jgi:hypothetical protein
MGWLRRELPDEKSTEALRQDILEVLKHHYEMVRLQQEVRDRWYGYYLASAGAIGAMFSLGIAILSAIPKQSGSGGSLHETIFATYKELGWTIPIALFFLIVLGVLFLGIYLFQIVNYRVLYLVIDNVYETLAVVHEPLLKKLQVPDPFKSPYGTLLEDWKGNLPKQTPQVLGADFMSNLVPIFINAFSFGALYLSTAWWILARLGEKLRMCHIGIACAFFVGLILIQIYFRNLFLMRALLLARQKFVQGENSKRAQES